MTLLAGATAENSEQDVETIMVKKENGRHSTVTQDLL